MYQTSYVMVKPGFANNIKVIKEVKRRLMDSGLVIENEGYINYTKESAKKHYHEHVNKPFYPDLEEYITSDKAYGMKVSGEDAIAVIRALAGATKNPEPGTIRYDIPEYLGIERRVTQNVVHSSDSENAAQTELAIFKDLLCDSTYVM